MRTIIFLLIALIIISCGGWIGDSMEELSGTYIFSYESPEDAVIYGGIGTQKVIPCNVKKYMYDDDYILAIQESVKPCSFPHEIKQEVGNIYYWIVDVKQDTMYSYLNKSDYLNKIKDLGVPVELKID